MSELSWLGYVLYEPLTFGPVAELSRAEARAEHEHFIGHRVDRIRGLASLVAREGIALDGSDASVDALDTWHREGVAPEPTDPGEMLTAWLSAAYDISLYLGEVAIARQPHLHWSMSSGTRNYIDFQATVLAGVRSDGPPLTTEVNLRRLIVTRGYWLLEGNEASPHEFSDILSAIAV